MNPEAFDHAEQHLHRQPGLDRRITVVGLPPRISVGAGARTIAGSNRIVSEPQRLSASLSPVSCGSCSSGGPNPDHD